MSYEDDCTTGCCKKEHMIRCVKCGLEYHIGLTHHCPTGYINRIKKWDVE